MIVNYRVCRRCNVHYLSVEFLPYRHTGYCTLECSIGEPRGVPTAESMAWKDKISVSSLRVRHKPEAMNDMQAGVWKFDMVHYPPPKGWQVENWRMETRGRSIETNTSKA